MLQNADYGSCLQRFTCFAALLLNNKTSLGSEGRRGKKILFGGGGRYVDEVLIGSIWRLFSEDVALSEQTWHLSTALF